MAFMPLDGGAEALGFVQRVVQSVRPYFNDITACFFGVVRDPNLTESLQSQLPGIRWFFDSDGEISRLFGALDAVGQAHPHWVLLDPALRVLAVAPFEQPAPILQFNKLPVPDLHAGLESPAPVLLAPRIFEPSFCRRLIDYYDQVGGSLSGFMMEENGLTVGRQDPMKKVRADAMVKDEDLCSEIRVRIQVRLAPFIFRAFQFAPTRIERYIVASYSSENGGHFHRHRDNTTRGTKHRQFAVSINLNSEEYVGGDLRFPEFSSKLYRPPTGGALVFSCSLLHEVTRVTAGRRYACLPFLYDEKAAEIRQTNLEFLDPALSALKT